MTCSTDLLGRTTLVVDLKQQNPFRIEEQMILPHSLFTLKVLTGNSTLTERQYLLTVRNQYFAMISVQIVTGEVSILFSQPEGNQWRLPHSSFRSDVFWGITSFMSYLFYAAHQKHSSHLPFPELDCYHLSFEEMRSDQEPQTETLKEVVKEVLETGNFFLPVADGYEAKKEEYTGKWGKQKSLQAIKQAAKLRE